MGDTPVREQSVSSIRARYDDGATASRHDVYVLLTSLSTLTQRLARAESQLRVYEEALKAIQTAVRGDEKGECWTIRRYLSERDIYNDDIQGTKRLVEEVCKAALASPDPQSGATK